MSIARGQRGWNGQPAGQVAGIGRVAGQAGRVHAEGRVADHREGGREPARVGVSGLGEDLVARAPLDDAPGVHHGDALADRGERRQVVGDEDRPPGRSAPGGPRAAAAPGPGPSRRARWWARRRSAAAGRRPAPARSARAGAGRPRAGAGSPAPGARAGPTSSSSSPTRFVTSPPRLWSAAGSPRRSGRPTRCTGFSVCSAPWKTIASAGPAHGPQAARASSSARPRRRAAPRRVTSVPFGSRRSSAPPSDDLPQPDSPASPSVSPASSSRSTPRTAGTAAAARAVGHVQVAHREQRGGLGSRLGGLRLALMRAGLAAGDRGSPPAPARTSVKASTTSMMPRPGGTMYHHASSGDRARLEGVVEHLAPGGVEDRRGRGTTAWPRRGSRSAR